MASARAADRREFRAFVQQLGYAPQGRHGRAGALEDSDLDAMMRGALQPVWHWVFRNIKNADNMELIRRNVRVARQQLESSKPERDAAKAQREALIRRKQVLVESLARAKAREQTLLRTMRALEAEDARATESVVTAKQREVLTHAYHATQDAAMRDVSSRVERVQEALTLDCSTTAAVRQRRARLGDTNPIAILVREYVRMLATEDADVVDFGDADIQHLRDFGSDALLQWLHALATQRTSSASEDAEDAAYAAHVAQHTLSSHDALAQVQALLQKTQEQHIAQFVATQALYAQAQQAHMHVREMQAESHSASGLHIWSSATTTQQQQQLVSDTVELEIALRAQQAALDVAHEAHATLSERIESAKQQRAALDDKLALLATFETRQRTMLEQLHALYAQNCNAALHIVPHQTHVVAQSAELQRQYTGRTDALVATWQQSMRDELRAFASASLAPLDTAVQTIALDAASAAMRDVPLARPFAAFAIRAMQHDAVDGCGGDAPGLARVLSALGVPVYSSWHALLLLLQQKEQQRETAVETLAARQELLASLARAHGEDAARAQSALEAVQRATDALQTAVFPLLEGVIETNRETRARALARLRTVIDDWYEQRGWQVALQASASKP